MLSKSEVIKNKIQTLDTLQYQINGWRVKGNKIVFTNGCFDILHSGHLSLLLQAADMGNKLVIGVNTDESVKKLKGETRPVNNEQDRALLLASQAYVDAVILFNNDTPKALIEKIVPDVLVKGGDYIEDTVVGADIVKNAGGKVIIVPLLPGYSTTSIIEKLH